MSVTLVATAGATDANSYLSDTDADALINNRLQVANWAAADADDQARALIMATNRIDQLTFQGWKSNTGQALKWPRIWTFDEDGYELDTASIPVVIQNATIEVALWLLNQNAASADPLQPTGLEAFKSATVGPISVEPDKSFRAGALPANVLRMLRFVLQAGGGGGLTTATLLRS